MKRQRFVGLLCGGVATAALLLTAMPASAGVKDDLKTADRQFDSGNVKKAARSYDKAIRRYPSQVPAGAYAKRASIYFSQKQNKGGLAFIDGKGLKQHPGSPEILSVKAAILSDMNQHDQAAKIAERVVSKKSDDFVSQQILGKYYFTRRKAAKAAKAWAGYLKYRPKDAAKSDVMPLIMLGYSYLGQAATLDPEDTKGRARYIEMARKQFDSLLKRFRTSVRASANANNGLCASYVGLGKWDRAITVCEKLIVNPNYIDRRGSVWYNLGVAYLKKRQSKKARTAGGEFITRRKSLAKGYLLVGDAYFQEREWDKALTYYLRAEKKARGNARVSAKIGIKLGLAYRRKGLLKKAIEKLASAIRAQPNNVKLASALGAAYLGNKQDSKALGTVDKLIRGKTFKGFSASEKTALLGTAAKAFYNQKKLRLARQRYASARQLNPQSVTIRIGLVQTINRQARIAFRKGKMNAAIGHLNAARAIRPGQPLTNQNFAVVYIKQKKCGTARKYLAALAKDKSYSLVYHRLMARTYLCQRRPNKGKAIGHFRKAEKEAIATQANLVRAEIYAEWAPLLFRSNLKSAVEKLESAEQFSSRTPGIANAVKRNLAVALFLRGRKHLKAARYGAAAADFERAARDPRVLKGSEEVAFEFSHAIAQLQRGRTGVASKIFRRLAKKGGQGRYLKAPYNRIGAQFFGALAKYRGGSVAMRRQAAGEFQRLLGTARGRFATQVRDLLASSWQFIAYDAWRKGNRRTGVYLRTAAKYAVSPAGKRNVAHNRAVMGVGTRGTKQFKTFKAMGTNPPEALVNLGVMHQRRGEMKKAYNAWVRAKRLGVRTNALNNWIARKKRIWKY